MEKTDDKQNNVKFNEPPNNLAYQNMGGRGRGHGGPPHMGGIAEKPRNMKATLLRLWAYFIGQRRWLVLVMLLVLLGSGVSLITPYLIGRAIDALISTGVNVASNIGIDRFLILMVLLLAGAFIIDTVCQYFQNFLMAGISQRMVKKLRSSLFDHFQQLPVSFFDTRAHGDLMSRLTNDIDNISLTVASSTSQLISLVVMLAGSLILMLVLSPLMTLMLLVPATLALILTRTIVKRTRPLYRKQQAELGNLSAQLEESISGLLVVRGFNHEKAVINDFKEINDRYYKASLMALIWGGMLMPMMNVINNLSLGLIGGFGSYLALSGVVSVGVIATFIGYSRQFVRPLNEIANIYNTLQTAIAGAERVFDILDQATEPADRPDAVSLRDVAGEIQFKEIEFGYRSDVPVIQGVSFDVPAGSSIALVGPTGAGKTTLVNLLARFYELDGGMIAIDGRDIREYKRSDLRKAFGIVLQDTYLFSGTIRENIRYGNPNADDSQVEAAARKSAAHEFIRRLPQAYDTVLAESGSNLSAGQRQLLAIARAILADAPILILDEATSNVDTRTELRIQKAMLELMKNRTTFLIAHRLSTIRGADRILVIDDRRIVEQGSHDKLLALGGVYAGMWKSQLENVGENSAT